MPFRHFIISVNHNGNYGDIFYEIMCIQSNAIFQD
jgi:hypothetical protein